MKNQIKGTVFLLLAAILWGASFVFQNEGAEIIDPIAFNGLRSLLGSLALLPVIAVLGIVNKKKGNVKKPSKEETKNLLLGGLLCVILELGTSTFKEPRPCKPRLP
ncbi:MAG: DMT family transporter [Clostridia bacterium]|nr:DMT family transporter [Clostridia bacterium]